MNSILLLAQDLESPASATLKGDRARAVQLRHSLKPGVRTKAALLNGLRGHVTVIEASPDKISLQLELNQPPPPRRSIDLIVAVPRPQTVKKVISLSTIAGIRSLTFVRSEHTEKSYLSSKSLREEEIFRQVELGLEQAFDSVPPEIVIFDSFWSFKKERLESSIPGRAGFLAHAGERSSGLQVFTAALKGCASAALAIGPESGWSLKEHEVFIEHGFHKISLGERIFRVEQAAAVLLGQLLLALPRQASESSN
ncbi:MAG: RNA methyltransferase [Deltaproteobacteria bacterium]|nr:RNA methyltransferase [Deltaproteobacteria bacterium]